MRGVAVLATTAVAGVLDDDSAYTAAAPAALISTPLAHEADGASTEETRALGSKSTVIFPFVVAFLYGQKCQRPKG